MPLLSRRDRRAHMNSAEAGAEAAEASPALADTPAADLADWIAALPAADKDKFLIMVADGEGPQVQALLLRRFRGSSLTQSTTGSSARTAAQLWAAAGARKAAHEEAKAQARRAEEERQAAAKAAAYGKRLDHLATRAEAAWQEAADLIETKKPRDYDLAVSLLRDLSALARREGEHDSFTSRFLELRARHERTPSRQERFDKAGLPRRP